MDDSSSPAAGRRNMPDAFFEIRRSLQAREILVALEKHGPANDAIFYGWLGTIGLGPSHRDLTDLLDRLEADGFIVTERVEQYRVIKATRAGIEIAQARSQADWIARIDSE
jgi:DNA-binding MarR family transcriptional regulator